MGVDGRLIVRSVIVFVLLLKGNSGAVIDFYKCDGVEAVLDLNVNHKSIYSHCNCTITTNFSGKLYFVQNCRTDILILNHSATIRLPCKGPKIHIGVNVVEGGKLFTISMQINKPLYESTILNQKIHIYALSYTPGLFSVICGSEMGDLPTLTSSATCISTTDTIKATKLYNSTNKTTGGNDWKTSLKKFSTVNFGAVIDFYKCDGAEAVLDLGANYKSIYSHCNCMITTNFSGKLYFAQNCSNDILILNHSGASIRLPCKRSNIRTYVNVVEGGKLFMTSTQINKPLYESTILNQKIVIFAQLGDLPTHRTSITYISTTETIKATKIHNATNKTTDDNDRKTSLNIFSTGTEASTSFAFPKAFTTNNAKVLPTSGVLPVYAAAAAGGVVVMFVITILVVLFIRMRNNAHSKNNENTREAGTNHNTNDPADVLYHSHQGNADGEGYSTCRLETRNLREELPANPLYQSYEENSVVDPLTPLQIKEDIYQSVSENVQYSDSAVDPHTSLQVMEDIYHRVPENNSVYSYAKPFQCSNKELNLVESKNDNVYAEVCKIKKK
uniref:Uncharacterized protein LOC111135955 isoform X2 n=1 Tax=Crassostrea virginica TaxID=6565 RepID=A0A8B8EQD7_CRAVI|nr:uncharacterized protein LOC111135955 isoform X2 [Crassostrea virginica]